MDIKIQLEKLMSDLKENVKDEESLKYVQEKLIKTLADILQEMDNNSKEEQKRITLLEDKIERMEKEFFLDDEIYDIEIVCPYCNHKFETEFDENKKEVKCPECNNLIELDWSCDCDDECDGSCGSCGGHHHN